MNAWATQRPVAEDIARFQPRFRIYGVQIIAAGGLAGQRCQGEVSPQTVQNADEIAHLHLSMISCISHASGIGGDLFARNYPSCIC